LSKSFFVAEMGFHSMIIWIYTIYFFIIWSRLTFISAGGEAKRCLPSRHRLCSGVWVHVIWSVWSHSEFPASSHRIPGQRLHDDAAERSGFLPRELYYAQGETVFLISLDLSSYISVLYFTSML